MPLFNYLLFDAAKAEQNLYRAMEMNANHASLYKGRAEEDLSGVAPYLFSVKPDSEFAAWYMAEGWGESWGVPLFANAAFEDVYKHFRKFLMVKTEDGEQLYFRFYDPRVLRIFLPTCDTEQLKDMFGPIRHYITETEENKNSYTQFWIENSTLLSKTHSLLQEQSQKSMEEKTDEKVEIQESKIESPIIISTSTVETKKKKFFLEE